MTNASVEIFPWTHNFETGIPLIDEQHKVLVELINELVTHLAYQADEPKLNLIFQKLKDYATFHFQSEEEIWDKYFSHDAWIEWHKQAHSDFIDGVIKLKQEEDTLPLDTVIENIVRFLTHWLANHILESDMRMAKVVLALPSGVSLEGAKEMANKEMVGSTRVLIDTVMSMYDKLASSTLRLTREIQKRKQAEQEMEKAKEKAEQANLTKSAFLSSMSHEIRTPLNAISGLVHMMRHDNPTPLQMARLSKIDSAEKHLANVINNILDLSKIEAGKFAIDEKDVSIESLLSSVYGMLEHQITLKKLSLIVEKDPFPKNLVGDMTRLQQCLLNYANNAIKFTPQGKITLRVRNLKESDVSVLIKFEVLDTGIGLEAQAHEKLFKDFEQTSLSITSQYGGTGLGLSITKKLAELMGGEVGYDSTLGVGSTFWFTAELKKSSNTSGSNDLGYQADSLALLKQKFSGKKILLVDDDPINQEVALWLLENADLNIDVADNGKQAVEKVAHNQYALILMDMQMPVMGGVDATREIRKLRNETDLPILAMTANSFNEDRDTCLSSGMNDFISKPITPEILYSMLLKWL